MIKDIVRNNRSCRSFVSGKKLSFDQVSEFVDTARYCGSGMNMQPMKYYVAIDSDECAFINKNTHIGFPNNPVTYPLEGLEPPAYLLICQDLSISNNTKKFATDTGILGQTITLAAAEIGISSCMIGNFKEKKIREKLDIGEGYFIQLIIALGYSAEKSVAYDSDTVEPVYYYREGNTTYVPKRKLSDIILNTPGESVSE